jgi:hypothetical protein
MNPLGNHISCMENGMNLTPTNQPGQFENNCWIHMCGDVLTSKFGAGACFERQTTEIASVLNWLRGNVRWTFSLIILNLNLVT